MSSGVRLPASLSASRCNWKCAASSFVSRRADHSVDRLLIGTLPACRRHGAGAQLAHGGLPHLGVRTQVVEGHGAEVDAAGPVGGVVAVDTEMFELAPLRRQFVGGLTRRGHTLRTGRRFDGSARRPLRALQW